MDHIVVLPTLAREVLLNLQDINLAFLCTRNKKSRLLCSARKIWNMQITVLLPPLTHYLWTQLHIPCPSLAFSLAVSDSLIIL